MIDSSEKSIGWWNPELQGLHVIVIDVTFNNLLLLQSGSSTFYMSVVR